jgi:hypothetical protein
VPIKHILFRLLWIKIHHTNAYLYGLNYVLFKHIFISLTNFWISDLIIFFFRYLAWMTWHQVHFNAFACLSKYGQSDYDFSHLEMPKYVMDVVIWEHCTRLRFLDMAKFTTLIPLSLLISNKIYFPTISLKISSLPNFVTENPNKMFIWYLGNLSNKKQTPWPLVRERTIPTERPPLVDEILMSTFVDRGVSRGQRGGSPAVVNLSFLDWSRYFSFK